MNVKLRNRKLVHEVVAAWETALSCTAGKTNCDKPFSTHPMYGDTRTKEPVTCRRCQKGEK